MGDVQLRRKDPTYIGTLKLDGKPRMTIRIATKGHVVTPAERRTFDDLAGIPMVNLRDGKPLVLASGAGASVGSAWPSWPRDASN